MAINPAFNSLLRSLKDADSAFERMHALGLAWRSIRKLSPTERKILARHAGFEGAEELVEKLALHEGGIAPSILLQAIQEARQSKPQRLKSIFASLRDPETRARTILNAMDTVASRLQEIGEEAAAEQAPAEENDPSSVEEQTIETADGTVADPLAQAVESPKKVPDAHLQEEEWDAPAVEPHEMPEPVQTTSLSPGSASKSDEDTPPHRILPRSEESPQSTSEDAILTGAVEAEVSPAEPRQDATATTPIDRVGEASTLFEKFRLLGDPNLEVVDREFLHWVIKEISPGWAQRRAIQLLIRNNRIADPDDALELCKRISGKHNQRWLLHEIQRKWELESTDDPESVTSN